MVPRLGATTLDGMSSQAVRIKTDTLRRLHPVDHRAHVARATNALGSAPPRCASTRSSRRWSMLTVHLMTVACSSRPARSCRTSSAAERVGYHAGLMVTPIRPSHASIAPPGLRVLALRGVAGA